MGGGIHIETCKHQGDLTGLLLFFSLVLLFKKKSKRRLERSPPYLFVCVTSLIFLIGMFGDKNPVPAHSENSDSPLQVQLVSTIWEIAAV
jgi:hypothetical protein